MELCILSLCLSSACDSTLKGYTVLLLVRTGISSQQHFKFTVLGSGLQ